MSGSNSRQLLPAFLSSKLGGKELRKRLALTRRLSKRRSLQLESLERRELMAADASPYQHNSLIATDVNGDFQISPIDALQVVNALNRQARGEGEVTTAFSSSSTTRVPMVDVNNDSILSPIDALMVINRLRSGEGIGELAGINAQVIDAAGNAVPSQVVGGVTEYTVSPGQLFKVRLQARDLRSSPSGVFGMAVDVDYATQGSPTTELAVLQYGEVNTLNFSAGTNGGTFTLRFGGETTAPIAFSTNLATLRNNVRNAVGALNIVGGTQNVRVESTGAQGSFGVVIDIFFIGDRARQDMPNAVIENDSLTLTGGGTSQLSIDNTFNPIDPIVVAAAIESPVNTISAGQTLTYNAVLLGNLITVTNPTPGFRLDDLGASNSQTSPSFDDAGAFVNIMDVVFRAASSLGTVDFDVNPTNDPADGLLLYGEDMVLADNLVEYPAPFRVRIAAGLLALDDTASVVENSSANTIDVLANDQKNVGTTFTVSAVTQPAAGGSVAIIDNNTKVSFTPANGFSGNTTFTYTLSNNLGANSVATVTVSVNPINDAPIARVAPFDINEEAVTNFAPGNLFTPGGPDESSQQVTLSNLTLISSASVGTVALQSGNVVLTPATDYNGPILFSVTGTDNGTPNQSTTATFTVNVLPVNDPPVSIAASPTVAEDSGANTINASTLFAPGPSNESSQSVSLVSVSAVGAQAGGSIAVSNGNAVFTPTLDFFGTFVFEAVAQDNGSPTGTSQPATFTITVTPVNDAPVANPDTGANRFVVPGASTNNALDVMVNDNAGPGEVNDTIRITAVGNVQGPGTNRGTVTINGDGTRVLYTPPDTLFGESETFTYTITDAGGLTSQATVEVFIVPPQRPFAVADRVQVQENSGQTAIDVLANDFINNETTRSLISFTALNPSSAGNLVLLDNGTPSDLSDDKIGFTPSNGFVGQATFAYTMNDSGSESTPSTANVTITVGEFNDPPILVDVTVPGTEDETLTILRNTILANASPGQNEQDQTLTITSVELVTANAGTARLANGNVILEPAVDVNGPVLIRYTVTDNGSTFGSPDFKSSTATITVNLAPVNDAPIAANDNVSGTEGIALTIAASTLTINDRPGPATAVDETNQTLSVVSAALTDSSVGTIAVVGSNVVFTPASFFNGTTTATYTIQDSGSGNPQSTATVTIQIAEVNNPPVPVAASRNAFATVPVNLDLSAELAQASRGAPNEASQTVRINRLISIPGTTRGTISLNANGTIQYTAPAGFEGQDVFDYEIIDNGTTNGSADPKTGIARVTVNVQSFLPSTVSGVVWIDDDRSSTFDAHELVMAGAEVVLTGRPLGAASDVTPQRVFSQANGRFTFTNLGPGTYTITFVPPSMTTDAPGVNSVTVNIVSPGGQQIQTNFGLLGVDSGYHTLLENLESNYYLRNGEEWRYRGLSALIRPNGQSLWTMNRGDYQGYAETSVFVDQATRSVILSVTDASRQIFDSVIPRSKYLMVTDPNGNVFIRIFAMPEELNFINSTPAIEGEGSSSTDRVFADGSWM